MTNDTKPNGETSSESSSINSQIKPIKSPAKVKIHLVAVGSALLLKKGK